MRKITRWTIASVAATLTVMGGTTCVTITPTAPTGPLPVASVTVTASAPTVQVDQKVQLTAVARDSLGRVVDTVFTWSADNHAPATGVLLVDRAGIATGNVPGPVDVTAAVGRRSATTRVLVTNIPCDSISVAPQIGMFIGAASQPVVTLFSAPPRKQVTSARRSYAWTVSNPSIVSIDTTPVVVNGVPLVQWWTPIVRGLAAGTARLTITVEGRSATVDAVVAALPKAIGVAVTPAQATLRLNESVSFAGHVVWETSSTGLQSIAWSMSDPTVAGFTLFGDSVRVTPRKPGSTRLIATADFDRTVTGSALITVIP